jgi:hypothetical protein
MGVSDTGKEEEEEESIPYLANEVGWVWQASRTRSLTGTFPTSESLAALSNNPFTFLGESVDLYEDIGIGWSDHNQGSAERHLVLVLPSSRTLLYRRRGVVGFPALEFRFRKSNASRTMGSALTRDPNHKRSEWVVVVGILLFMWHLG